MTINVLDELRLLAKGKSSIYGSTRVAQSAADEIEQLKSAGWRACIDHIIRPDSPCPVCEIERLRDAMVRAQKETGTSTSTWHVLEDALRGTTKNTLPKGLVDPSPNRRYDEVYRAGVAAMSGDSESEQDSEPVIAKYGCVFCEKTFFSPEGRDHHEEQCVLTEKNS